MQEESVTRGRWLLHCNGGEYQAELLSSGVVEVPADMPRNTPFVASATEISLVQTGPETVLLGGGAGGSYSLRQLVWAPRSLRETAAARHAKTEG